MIKIYRHGVVGYQVTWCLAIAGLMLSCAVYGQNYPADFTVGKRYNLNGQLTATISPNSESIGPQSYVTVRNTYNTRGLLEKVEAGVLYAWPPHTIKPEDWESEGYSFQVKIVEHYTHDNWGRKSGLRVQDDQGLVRSARQYSYDSLGRLQCEAVRMNMNSLPDNACSLGAAGPYGQDRITRYSYDNKDRITRIEKAYGTNLRQDYARYTYNNFWEIASVQDANDNLTAYRYDGFGRLRRQVFPSKTLAGQVNEGDYEEYRYDDNGNRTRLRKRDGRVINYTYDRLNRVITKDLPGTANDVFYDYDNRGLQLYARYVSHTGKGIITQYNGFGQIHSSVNTLFPTPQQLTYDYDAHGNRTRITHPDNRHFDYRYDGVDKLSTILEGDTSTLITAHYNDFTQLETVARPSGASTRLGYDGISRVESFTHQLGGTQHNLTSEFTYNPASQIIRFYQSNGLYYYKDSATITGAYTVNGLNQYTSVAGKNFTYDNNGNLTHDGSVTYAYDIENRLISASGGKNATLKYDPLGRLYEVSGNGATTRFLYDGDALIAEYNTSDQITRRYVHGQGADTPLVEYHGNAVNTASRRFLYTNHQGSVVANTLNNGNLAYINTYDDYGIPGQANQGRFGYTGQIYLPEIGLYHYKARVYSPYLGRFLQTDPIGYEDQMNLYAYVHNDPLNFTDPTGEFGVIGFAIGFAADAAAQYMTKGKVDIRQSLVSGAVGAVTGGAAGLARSSMTVGGRVVATTGEKALAASYVASTSVAAGATGHVINAELNGEQATLRSTGVDAALNIAGPGKAASKTVGTVADVIKELVPSAKSEAGDIATKVGQELSSKTVTQAIDEKYDR